MAIGPTTEIPTRHNTEYLFDDARESAAGDSRQILGRMAKGEQMERIQVSSGKRRISVYVVGCSGHGTVERTGGARWLDRRFRDRTAR